MKDLQDKENIIPYTVQNTEENNISEVVALYDF